MLSGALILGSAGCTDEPGSPAGRASTGDPIASTPRSPVASSPASSGSPLRTDPASRALRIVVTNDDGVRAPGIARLARALRALPRVEVWVVAPSRDRSGTGSSTTSGAVAYGPARTAGGLRAVSVRGYPADAVRVALRRLDLDPDLVVAGVNRGLNTGGAVKVSGTVGAARAALAYGVQAIAASAQRSPVGTGPHYRVAVRTVTRWVADHRAALLAGTVSTRTLLNVNTPTCTSGSVRGVARVRTAGGERRAGPSRCRSTLPRPRTDAVAIERGFTALSRVPR